MWKRNTGSSKDCFRLFLPKMEKIRKEMKPTEIAEILEEKIIVGSVGGIAATSLKFPRAYVVVSGIDHEEWQVLYNLPRLPVKSAEHVPLSACTQIVCKDGEGKLIYSWGTNEWRSGWHPRYYILTGQYWEKPPSGDPR